MMFKFFIAQVLYQSSPSADATFDLVKGAKAMYSPDSTASSIYTQLATSSLNTTFLALANIIVIVIVARKVVGYVQEALEKGGDDRDNAKMFMLVWKGLKLYGWVLAVGLLFPILLSYIEQLLTAAAAHINYTVKGSDPYSQLKQEIADFTAKHQNDSWYDDLSMDYIGNWFMLNIFKPILVFFNQYTYFMYCMVRYFYLILLEIVSPIAIVCLLDEKYHNYFQTWLRYMIICFLMLPAFAIANKFCDIAVSTVFGAGQFDLLPLLAGFLLKLMLLRASKKYIMQLI